MHMFDSNSTIDIRPNKLPAKQLNSSSSGFTLMEVMVSVTIFAFAITLMMSLFNYTLKIYRRVEAQRQVSQSVRTTMEFLVKEIRNGKVDYSVQDGALVTTPLAPCNGPGLTTSPTQSNLGQDSYSAVSSSLALVNVDGERECVYWDSTSKNLFLKKEGVASVAQLNPPAVALDLLKLYIRPLRDPFMDSPNLVEKEPVVTIVAQVTVRLPTGEVRTVPYQTSVSTYIYDIPSQ